MTYVWLVEEFGPEGNSTGRYMLDMGSLAITCDVYAARQLRWNMSAGFRALDMKEKHGGDWRAVEHGFLTPPEPAPQAEPDSKALLTFYNDLRLALRRYDAGTHSPTDLVAAVQIALAVVAPQAEPAAVGELPPLPEPAEKGSEGICCGNFTTGAEYMGQREELCCGRPDEAWPDYYTADQMRDYARAALASAPHAREPLTDEIERLRADLISCRGTVKAERNHYERQAEIHRGRPTFGAYEAEAKRLDDLLERIDGLMEPLCTKVLTDGKPCGLRGPCPDCGPAVHDVPEGA